MNIHIITKIGEFRLEDGPVEAFLDLERAQKRRKELQGLNIYVDYYIETHKIADWHQFVEEIRLANEIVQEIIEEEK